MRIRRHRRFVGNTVLAASATVAVNGGCADPTTTNGDDAPPTVSIQSPGEGAVFQEGTAIEFRGTGVDPEDGTLPDDKLGWQSSQQGQLGTGKAFTRTDLNLGPHTIRFTGVDSENNAAHATVSITVVPANLPPTATILTPQNGAVFQLGQSIQFTGTGTDPEDGQINASLTWTSSINSTFGVGPSVSFAELLAGVHQITLMARDAGDLTGTATISIRVNALPVVNITSPANGSAYANLEPVTFAGGAIDAEDGNLPAASLRWMSSIDGDLGTGSGFTRTLSSGTHIITLIGTDSDGGEGSQQVSIMVAGNQPPQVTITSPAHNSMFTTAQQINFTGSANDPESGPITGVSLAWRSSLQGALGTDSPLSRTLNAGTHLITLEATDPQGAKGTASVTVIVQTPNSPPNFPTITSPSNGANFVTGTNISFTGSATDPEDGPLTGTRLTWTSSINGPVGTGTSTSSSTLSAGTHTITLRATDSQGLFRETSIQITLEAAVKFSTDIVPLLRQPGSMVFSVGSCTGCHFSGSVSPPDFATDPATYNNIRARVTPGDPTVGALMCKITHGIVAAGHCSLTVDNMTVTNPALATFIKWIQQGALNN